MEKCPECREEIIKSVREQIEFSDFSEGKNTSVENIICLTISVMWCPNCFHVADIYGRCK